MGEATPESKDVNWGRTTVILHEDDFNWIAKKGRKFNFSAWVRDKIKEEKQKENHT
jgi:hypothetical protein